MADTETIYSFRVRDLKSGQHVGGGDDYGSPYEVGQALVDWYAVLMLKHGYNPEQLDIEGVVIEGGQPRDWTDAEQAASVSALQQFLAAHESD